MNCSRFETILSDYLDGVLEGPVRSAVDVHLKDCQRCQELSFEVESLREQLGAFPMVRPPEDLVDKILERTTGKPKVRSLWADLVVPTVRPFLTQRYAFATIVLFVFMSLMVNLAGPPVAAVFSPSRLAEEADRVSGRISKTWAEWQNFKSHVGEELSLLSEDLYGRIDYHLISMMFKSYSESMEEEQKSSGESEASGEETPSQECGQKNS